MKAGKFWTPYAKEKVGVRLGPNMRKDGATDHMDTAYQMTQPRREVVTVDDAWAAFQKVVPECWWRFAEEDPYGGVHMKDGRSVSSIEFCYQLSRVARYLTPAPYVLEIGGGYGGMARMILQFRNDISVTIVDLEPMLPIQKHYLENTTSPANEVSFVTEIPDKRWGFAMNTRSMCEMDLAEVNAYLARLDEVLLLGAKFYSMNHDKCRNSFKHWRVPANWKLVDERTFPLPWKRGAENAWVERTWEKT